MWEGVAHNLSSGSIDDVSSDPRDGQILVSMCMYNIFSFVTDW